MYKKLIALGLASWMLSGCSGGDYAWLSSSDVSIYENYQGVAYHAELTRTHGETIAFQIEGIDAALFTIDSQSGDIQFIESPDYEAPKDARNENRYQITVVSVNAQNGERLSSLHVNIHVQDAEQVKATQLFPLPNSYVQASQKGVVPLAVVFEDFNAPIFYPEDWQTSDAQITRFYQYYPFGIETNVSESALADFLDPNQFDGSYLETILSYLNRSFSTNFNDSTLLNYGYTINPTSKITVSYANKVQGKIAPVEMEWALADELGISNGDAIAQPNQLAISQKSIYLASENAVWRMTREGKQLVKLIQEENVTIEKLVVIYDRILVLMNDSNLQRWVLKELNSEDQLIELYTLSEFNEQMIRYNFDVEILYNDFAIEVVFLPRELCGTNDIVAEPALYRFSASGFKIDKSLLTNSTVPLFNCKDGHLVDRNLSFDLEFSSPRLSYNPTENSLFFWGRSYTEDNINGITMSGGPSSVTIGTQYWFDAEAEAISQFQHFSRYFDNRKSFYLKDKHLYVADGHINASSARITSENYQINTYTVDASADLIYSIGLWGNAEVPALAVHHLYSGATSYIPLNLQ